VVASFDITSQWFTAAKGRITMPSAGDKIIGGHCVCVAGYDYSEGMFFFPNSWGAQWGDDGHGSMSFEYFDKHMTEAWVMDGLRQMPPHKEIDQVQYLNWGIPTTLGVTLHGVEVYHYRTDARIGWAFCVQHHDVLEIEELFVRPDYRGKGYGRILAKMILELKDEFKLPIRLWIPHPDATPSKLPFLTRFLPRLGVSISPSPFRWASLVANSGQGTGMTSTPSISPSTPANLFPAVENA